MMKIGATFVFALLTLFVSFDIISSVPTTALIYPPYYNGSSTTGFAQITTTDVKNQKKTRECEEWKKHEVTGQWKCIKFIVIPTK